MDREAHFPDCRDPDLRRRRRAEIVGTGSAVPDKVLTNFDLEKMVNTSDEWIRVRTGVQRRHIADDKTTTATLAAQAAQKAMDEARIDAKEIDFILVATVTPEMFFPSTACCIQDMLGATNAAAMDMSVGCSGFIYALSTADALIFSGKCDNALVIGVETLSKITNWTDRNTCVLFGDGAGAAIVSRSNDETRGIIATYTKSDGSLGRLLMMPGGGSRNPASHRTIDEKMHFVKMEGHELFRPSIMAMVEATSHILKRTGFTNADINLLIPHQANIRIIEAMAKRLGFPMEKVYVNLQEYGNTSAASIPLALDEARKKGLLKQGDLVLMVAFGAGLTWGSALVRF